MTSHPLPILERVTGGEPEPEPSLFQSIAFAICGGLAFYGFILYLWS